MSGSDLNISRLIIERCLEGDIKAQFMLYKQYSKAMYNIAIRLLNIRIRNVAATIIILFSLGYSK